ncbi:TorF family putative porin [Dechloromonas agitata]|uniref:TorF family putative porin n=1 Tax=Dechloromonas agitata TaxID=73030 RepID=UPI000481BD1D|nr:TorF family putative porin [Dechloromonas agitata]MDE1544507.1 TorF family putative porin [Dechloromonas agitata]
MKKSVIALTLAGVFAAPAFAEEAAPTPEHTLTGNVGLFSSYRFRGIDQTFGKPALQGGFDYAHSSGVYVGNWNSNVSSGAGFPDGNLEMDFYGGYKTTFGDFGLDVGAILYYYPGTQAKVLGTNAEEGAVNNKEVYLGASWKFVSLKYSYAFDDYFSLRGWDSTGASTGKSTKGSSYIDLSANYDLGNGWGINGHVGHLNLKNGYKGDYTDWKIGVTKDINGWVLGLSYVDTNAAGRCSGASDYQFYCFTNSNSETAAGGINFGSKSKDAGRAIAVFSVSKTF